MATASVLFFILEKTRIVLLLALSQVGGNKVFTTGSSLYSRVIKTQRSMSCSSISFGSRFWIRSFWIFSIKSALSLRDKIFCENKGDPIITNKKNNCFMKKI